MNKRYIAAVILGTIGFMLMLGAIGSLEADCIGIPETFVRGGIGLVLALVAVPVSGDFKKENRP